MKNIAIIKPENPFWKVFKRFGRDEVIALVFNVIGTVIIAAIVNANTEMANGMKIFLISIAGPVIEKLGFYPAHLYEGWKIYKRDGGKLRSGLWRGIKNGSVSLLEDLLVHDPVYILLMLGGQSIYAGTPEWILAFTSFVIAVGVVSVGEVGVIELLYKAFKYGFKGIFDKERYYESRFYVPVGRILPTDFIRKISEKFDLDSKMIYTFKDRYYKERLPMYNGRIGKVRRRFIKTNEREVNKFQVTYTRAGEIPQNILSQYRFFINKKEKFSMRLNGEDSEVRSFKYFDPDIYSDIEFMRHSARKENGLYAAIDEVLNDQGEKYAVIELKVFTDKDLIKDAMKFVMDEFNVVQTTHGKIDIKS